MRRTAFCLLVVVVSALCATTAHAQRWQAADLTAQTGGPEGDEVSTMAMAFDPAYNAMRTHYVSNYDNHVHELFYTGGFWQHADLTAITGGALAMSYGPLAMAFDPVWNGMRTHHLGADRHIHELFLQGDAPVITDPIVGVRMGHDVGRYPARFRPGDPGIPVGRPAGTVVPQRPQGAFPPALDLGQASFPSPSNSSARAHRATR